jgi:hypothetical protein
MQTDILEQLINDALKNRLSKKTSFKYELKIGDFPILITFSVN